MFILPKKLKKQLKFPPGFVNSSGRIAQRIFRGEEHCVGISAEQLQSSVWYSPAER